MIALLLVLNAVLGGFLPLPLPFPRDDPVDIRPIDATPQPIDRQIYLNLFTYAHLLDIAYCVSGLTGIEEPFSCDLDCAQRFPNMTLVHQWSFKDSVTGFIATTHANIFDYNETTTAKKTVVVSLRGTRSIFDSLADLKTDMVPYSNLRYSLPYCGPGCKVHDGFFGFFQHTLLNIHDVLENELRGEENYELVVLGHSMGGSIGLLLGLHFLDLGYENLTLVTMGLPLVGNKDFATWADTVLGSSLDPRHNSYQRKYFRVVHRNDIVPTLPRSSNPLDGYAQFENQIYLNCSSSMTVPPPETVLNCLTSDNRHCLAGDFESIGIIGSLRKNYYEAHNTYFRKLGLCGVKIGLPKLRWGPHIFGERTLG